MTHICVNPYDTSQANKPSLNDTDVPRCIANWAHTEDQLLIAAIIWCLILIMSLVWMMVAKRQRRILKSDTIGFSLACRRWARTSRTAAIINRPLQLIVSILIFFAMLNRCTIYEVSSTTYHLMTALYIITFLDDGVRFFASRYKLLHCFNPFVLLQVLMIGSHIQVGWGPIKHIGGVKTRSWLDFSILRPIFILRSYLEMEKHVPRSTRGWMMIRLAIKVQLLIICGACLIFFVETLGEMPFFQNNGFSHLYVCDDGTISRNGLECTTETWSVMFSFYFTVVTLGTVGYGDNSPKTVLSRVLVIVFIVLGVILFSLEIENLQTLYQSRQIGNPPYKPKPDTKHVVIMGNPRFAQLSCILRELFHEDHAAGTTSESNSLHAVILGDRQTSQFTKALVAKLAADPIFAARVTYVAGQATNVDDLKRVRVRDAQAVLVFPDKLSEDAAHEDGLNILRVLAIRRYCGSAVRCLVMVLRAESARYMLASGVDRDDVICEHVIKMGTLAQNAMTHGVSTMLANLASSLSIGANHVEETTRGQEELKTRQGLLHLRTGSKDHHDLRLSHLERTECHTLPSTSTAHHHRWLKEYYEGAGKEMYMIHLCSRYAGMTFATAATRIFQETNGSVVLIAVEVSFSGTRETASDTRVLLNPGQSLLMAEWMQCYVIADDLGCVFEYHICPDEVTRDDIFQRLSIPLVYRETKMVLNEQDDPDQMNYAALATPTLSTKRLSSIEMGQSVKRHENDTVVRETIVLDRLLRDVACNYQTDIDHPLINTGTIDPSTIVSTSSFNLDLPNHLEAPSLSVLLHPKHIVICSFLGEESLASLQWLLTPLRSPHLQEHVPITILDAVELSQSIVSTLQAFDKVYYVRGSPLVYSDLQRVGAKAAAAVIVLSKRAHAGLSSTSEGDVESSIIDAEAIFSTMLISLKMDFTKIFTITELADESNSKFIGTTSESFEFRPYRQDQMTMKPKAATLQSSSDTSSLSWWEYLLLNDIPPQKSEKAIFGLPLYMSGRILHPELCENMLVQTFYNPSIHKIIRQLVGGPHCTGTIQTIAIPPIYRRLLNKGQVVTFSHIFSALASSVYSGICVGVYRLSTQTLGGRRRSVDGVDHPHNVHLRIVLTTPDPNFEMVQDDQLFVLMGIHTLTKAAIRIQRFYRFFGRKFQGSLLDLTSSLDSTHSTSSHDPLARIAQYLAPSNDTLESMSLPQQRRGSFIAQESSISFSNHYV